MGTVRTVGEHQSVIAELITRPEAVVVPLEQAVGRVLAQDLVAARPLPAFDNSAMDGYAVRAADIACAAESSPVTLPVAEDIPAGRVDGPALKAGTAHRIMTGAPIPDGADAVVQVEATDGGTTTVAINAARTAGTHVRTAGEDVQAGETVLCAGAVLGASQLGLIAALGEPSVTVIPTVRVLVISTGSELVEPGQPLLHGQIHESNGIMLATAVRAAGAVAEQLHFVADDVAAFHEALRSRLAHVDLIVTSGGVSAGAYEVVKAAFTSQGVEFVKVAMQPGMPQGCGRVTDLPGVNGTAVVTLPGNPVSALVSFEVFVRPALRAALGHPRPHRPRVRARLAEPIDSPPGRRQFRRGRIDAIGGTVTPVGAPGSHLLAALARADCLLVVDEATTHVPAGDEVEVWLLD